MAPIIITSTEVGSLAVQAEDGQAVGFWLTACCGAAVTGVCEGSVCKGCHRVVDARLGFSWTWDDIAGTSVLMDHVEGLIPALDSAWAFKLVASTATLALQAVA
jgi:hypothetical protein